MKNHLFQPTTLRGLDLPNRIAIAPMCQFRAVDGSATDWHTIHLGHLALSGAGLMILEATGVEPRGRISHQCLGLYSDANEEALARVLKTVRAYSGMAIGMQLGHAGRKASMMNPVDGKGHLAIADGGWETIGPSAVSFAPNWPLPRAMDRSDMDDLVAAFVQATQRCERLGFDLIEIHAAHGYLLSSFLSPIANLRTDAYGGSFENRMRFPLEVIAAVRAAWPAERPLGIRFNGTDWDERGLDADDAVAFARELARLGCDYVDLSSGGNCIADIPTAPGYQVPYAARVKAETGLPTMAVGLIRQPEHAEGILAAGQADFIALGRAMLNDPRWPWHAAEHFGIPMEVPLPYRRAATKADTPNYGR